MRGWDCRWWRSQSFPPSFFLEVKDGGTSLCFFFSFWSEFDKRALLPPSISAERDSFSFLCIPPQEIPCSFEALISSPWENSLPLPFALPSASFFPLGRLGHSHLSALFGSGSWVPWCGCSRSFVGGRGTFDPPGRRNCSPLLLFVPGLAHRTGVGGSTSLEWIKGSSLSRKPAG